LGEERWAESCVIVIERVMERALELCSLWRRLAGLRLWAGRWFNIGKG